MPAPITVSGEHVDLSPRFFFSNTVTGNPALAAETIICTVTTSGDVAAIKGIALEGCFSATIGTSGVSATVKIRQTNVSGATIYTTGANTVTAANLYTLGVQGFDSAPVLPGQVYVMTLTVGSGAATSTVSSASLFATIF